MFERIVTMNPAYDKRNADPSKNYGIHGVDLRMVLVVGCAHRRRFWRAQRYVVSLGYVASSPTLNRER
jgi:hypothetical protein